VTFCSGMDLKTLAIVVVAILNAYLWRRIWYPSIRLEHTWMTRGDAGRRRAANPRARVAVLAG
jgi:hypothetical protein